MIDVGLCRYCEQGQCLLLVCPTCDALIAMCDECDAIWLDPSPNVLPVFPRQPDLPCPHCLDSGSEKTGWERWLPCSEDRAEKSIWKESIRRRRPREVEPNEQDKPGN